MDGQQFDALVRTLAQRQTRRRAIKAISTAFVGFVSVRAGQATAQDSCAEIECNTGFVCIEGACVAETPECSGPGECQQGFQCVEGTCVQYCALPDETCGDGILSCCDSFMCVEGICVPVPCRPLGAGCPPDEMSSVRALYIAPCCEGLICTAEGVCAYPCTGEGGECTSHDDCCVDLVCWEGACVPPAPTCGAEGASCWTAEDCCPGMICTLDGYCAWSETPDEPETPSGPTDSGVGGITTLPGTGSGPAASSHWAEVATIGGAAAIVAGIVRRHRESVTRDRERFFG